MKSGFLITVILFLVVGFWLAVDGPIKREHPVITNQSNHLKRSIRYSFTLKNRTNRLLSKTEFWTSAPVNQTSYQQVDNLECSHPYEIVRDDLHNQVLHFTFPDSPPFGTRIITINSQLRIFEYPRSSPSENLQQFLQPDLFIESGHPDIIRLADKLAEDKPSQTVRSIFDWVANSIQYTGFAGNARGALYALRKRKGDCTEYMSLFVALCRAAGIPARGIGGYVTERDAVLKPAGYHNWAEFYENGVWKLADPQRKIFDENLTDYIAMRIINGSAGSPAGEFGRFTFAGEGLTVAMNE